MADLVNVDYNTSIPNNVDLAGDRRVLKALPARWAIERAIRLLRREDDGR